MFNQKRQQKLLRFFSFLIIWVVFLSMGCSSHSNTERFPHSMGKLGLYLPIETFKYQFNLVSELDIGRLQMLKNDSTLTSYLYSFGDDLAISLLEQNNSDSIVEAFLVTTFDSINRTYLDSIVYACDPYLSPEERNKILNTLYYSPEFTSEKGSLVIKDHIIFRLKQAGLYIRFSAEEISS